MRTIDIIMAKRFGKGKKGMVIGWPWMMGAAGGTETTVTGVSPLLLETAIKAKIKSLTQYGLCSQADTPTPSAPVPIMCNNGELRMVDDELPAGYKRLTGIRFDGDTWYETGEALTGADDVTMTLDNTASQGQNVFGSYNGTSSGSKNFSLFIYGNGGTSNSYFRYGEQLLRPRFGTGERTITFGQSGTDGFATDASATPDTFTTPANAYIGMLPNSTSPAYTGDIKGNITAGTRLKWIPCERAADGVIGYYEAVKGNFIAPSGTGTPTSLGYDGSHYSLAVVGTDEVLTIGTTETTRETIVPEQTIVWASNSYSLPSSCVAPLLTFIKGDTAIVTVDGVETTVTITSTGSNPSASSYWVTVPLPNSWSVTADGHDSTAKVYFGSTPKESSTHTLKIEKATTTTEIFGTASVPDLFSVGDYADEIEIISGGITRKVGMTILTGEETGWALSDSGTTHRFRGTKPSDCHTPASRAPSVCTHFKYVSTGSAVGGMFIGASSYWYFIPTDQTIDTAEKWTAWLKAQYAAGTPVIVLYPLKEETTESVTPQPLNTAAGDNGVSVTANVEPIQLEAVYMKGA